MAKTLTLEDSNDSVITLFLIVKALGYSSLNDYYEYNQNKIKQLKELYNHTDNNDKQLIKIFNPSERKLISKGIIKVNSNEYNYLSQNDKANYPKEVDLHKFIIDSLFKILENTPTKFDINQISIPEIKETPLKIRKKIKLQIKKLKKEISLETKFFIYMYFLILSDKVILRFPIKLSKEVHTDLNFNNLIKTFIELLGSKKYTNHYLRKYIEEKSFNLNTNDLRQFQLFQSICSKYIILQNENLFLDY